MGEPRHLPLAMRKALHGRLALFQAEAPIAAEVSEDDSAKIAKAIFLTRVSGRAGQETENHIPFDAALKGALAEAAPNACESAAAKQLVDRLTARVGGLSCADCAGPGGRVCDGGAHDDALGVAGPCLVPLSEIFAAAMEIADAYYGAYCPPFRRPKVAFATTHYHKPKQCIDRAIMLDGKTLFLDGSGALSSEVELAVSAVAKFDWNSYLTTLYLLVHEVMCHAFAGAAAGIRPVRGRVFHADEYDDFSEGWMDYVVFCALQEIGAGRGPVVRRTWDLEFLSDLLAKGATFQHCRRDPLCSKSDDAKGIKLAWDAAERTLRLLRYLIGDPGAALDGFFRLSLTLNLRNRPIRERTAIVARAHQCLYADGRMKMGAEPPEFANALKRFTDSGDLSAILAQLKVA